MSREWKALLRQAVQRQEQAVARYERWAREAPEGPAGWLLQEIAQQEAEHLEFLRHVEAGDWRRYLNSRPGQFQPAPDRERDLLVWRLPDPDL